MSFIKADRNQTILLGHCLDDFVEKDAKIRYIVALIDKLDLGKLYSRYSEIGTDAYDPKIMLAIVFLSFTESVYGTRKIEYYCKKHMDYIYASCNLRPDHTTISRFIQKNIDLLQDIFKQIILRAKKKGYVNFKEIAIDGSKIKSSSSKKRSYKESTLEKYIKGVEKEIKKYLEELNEDASPEKKEEKEEALEKLKEKKEKLELRKKELQERKAEIKKDHRANHQINIVEPEAYMMELGYGQGFYPAYNTQLSVDTETQLIISADVITDRNDSQTFSRQHKNIKEILGKQSEDASRSSATEEEGIKYVADNGYKSYEQLEYIKENQINAYVYIYEKDEVEIEEIKASGRKIVKDDFCYDKANDCYICPMGKTLSFYKKENNKHFKGRRYRSTECSECSIKKQCLANNNKSEKREIRRDDKEYLADEMKEKIKQKEAEELFHKRKTSVEPVFGNIKSNMNYSRFSRRGLENVQGEFTLISIAHNINKLFAIVRAKMASHLSNLANYILGNYIYKAQVS